MHVTGKADPATAWHRYADLDAWTQWSPQIRRVDTGPVHDVGVAHDADADADQEREALDDLESTPPVSGTDPAPRRIAPGLRGVVVGAGRCAGALRGHRGRRAGDDLDLAGARRLAEL